MTAKDFFKLVELRTKSASILPYLVGTLFAVVYFEQFELVNALIMFISLISIDLATTTLNHLQEDKSEFSTFHLDGTKYSRGAVRRLVFLFLTVGIMSGALLAWRTGPIVWFTGILSFLFALTYSTGPLPIYRTPLAEIISGFFMGFVIIFLATQIHLGNDSFQAYLFAQRLTIELELGHLGALFILSLPLVTAISNVMLANNLCDMAADYKIGRYTLPILIGREQGLILFNVSYLLGAVAIGLGILFKILPLRGILIFLVYIPVFKNARRFSRQQDKIKTFPLAVWNLNLIGLALVATLLSQLLF